MPMHQATLDHKLIHGDCLEVLRTLDEVPCIFSDPPDNIGLGYNEFHDKRPDDAYVGWLDDCLHVFVQKAGIVWVSYNAKWSFAMGILVSSLLREHKWLEAKPCIQTFTFGRHNHKDLGNNHRPLLRLKRDYAAGALLRMLERRQVERCQALVRELERIEREVTAQFNGQQVNTATQVNGSGPNDSKLTAGGYAPIPVLIIDLNTFDAALGWLH